MKSSKQAQSHEVLLDTKLPVSFGGLGSVAPGEGDTELLISMYLGEQWMHVEIGLNVVSINKLSSFTI